MFRATFKIINTVFKDEANYSQYGDANVAYLALTYYI
jgi:hypothetical protein